HVCPLFLNLDRMVCSTARSISASSATMTGACPPSSIVIDFTVSALDLINDFPTGVDPVKVTFFTYSLSVKASPAVFPFALMHCSTLSGNPASSANSIKRIVVSGVDSAGLQTKVQPAASAGAAFRVIIAAGKFHGVIAATSPIGACSTR